jgi:predicted nucleic acid-binding protein
MTKVAPTIVVSDTSPLTNLAAIGQFDLLRRLYTEIHIADGVWDELNAEGKRWPGAENVAAARWVRRHAAQNKALVKALRRDLDQGEAESIALALELNATLLLLDEKEGRHIAERLGLRVVGVVGVLLEAKAKGVIDRVRPHLDALRQTAGFFLSEPVYQSALVLANEEGRSE